MALSSDQWQQITDIIIFTWQSGRDTDAAINAVAGQLGMDAVWQLSRSQWDYMFSLGANTYAAGYANNEVSAKLAQTAAPWFAAPPADTGPGSELGGDLTSEQRSAKANLDNFLSQYGLETLGDYVWKEYLNNIPVEQIMLDIRNRPEYIARFPAMKTLQEKGHAMSEAEYIAYEKQVAGFARAVGMPAEMFDQPDDFMPLLSNELSVQEVAQRIQDWVSFADSAPEANKIELQRLYGVDTAGIAAYFMNPEKALPLLEKQSTAALTGVSSIASGYGQLSQQEAEYIAGLGYKPEQTREGFGNLVNQRELFNPLDAGEQTISREQQLQAMFGANAGAQQVIERQASRRAAQFQQGGGFATGKEGISGIGAAR